LAQVRAALEATRESALFEQAVSAMVAGEEAQPLPESAGEEAQPLPESAAVVEEQLLPEPAAEEVQA
jgi:hypothetical protein